MAFITLSCLAILAVSVFGYLFIRHSYAALKLEKQRDSLLIAKNISAQINELLVRSKRAVSALAGQQNIAGLNQHGLVEILSLTTESSELIDGIALLDMNGLVLATDRIPPETKDMLPHANEMYKLLVEPVKNGTSVRFSRSFLSRSGEIMAGVLSPVFRDGRPHCVVAGLIVLNNHVMGGIKSLRIGKTGHAYIVDPVANSVIAHSLSRCLLGSAIDNPYKMKRMLTESEGFLEFTDERNVLTSVAFARISATGWDVVLRQPTEEFYIAVRESFVHMLIFLIWTLVSMLAIGIFLAWKIAAPLAALSEGVKKVAAGDLEARIPVRANDDIGKLASAFNDMTAKLRLHLKEMDKSHREMLATQEHVLRSEKMAAIGQLAAGLAHEIYNPLNIISGFTELMLKQGARTEQGKKYLEEIGRETVRCQKLVAELLCFARPRERSFSLVDLGAVIRESVALIRSQANLQGITIDTSMIDPGLPEIMGDKDQIKQVLLNLSLNACHAMPAGGELRISGYFRGDMAAVDVRDTGTGIKPRDMANLFTPFFTTRDDGTGLGLALSYAIIQGHGGEITVQSEEGKGALFTITFPLPEGEHDRVI